MQKDVLTFWFEELKPSEWFEVSEPLDQLITDRFSSLLNKAKKGELSDWRETAHGRLAEILILDQFSRNIYRGRPEAFTQDALALVLSQETIRAGADKALSAIEKSFLYMPYMHSESVLIHEEAMILFDQPGLESNHDFERRHKAIIDRFGRYPHRNAIVGRQSTAEEVEFLKEPGSSF